MSKRRLNDDFTVSGDEVVQLNLKIAADLDLGGDSNQLLSILLSKVKCLSYEKPHVQAQVQVVAIAVVVQGVLGCRFHIDSGISTFVAR